MSNLNQSTAQSEDTQPDNEGPGQAGDIQAVQLDSTQHTSFTDDTQMMGTVDPQAGTQVIINASMLTPQNFKTTTCEQCKRDKKKVSLCYHCSTALTVLDSV